MRSFLVVANQTLGGVELAETIDERLKSGAARFHVVVPLSPVQHRLTWDGKPSRQWKVRIGLAVFYLALVALMAGTSVRPEWRRFVIQSAFHRLDDSYRSVVNTRADGHMAGSHYLAAKSLEAMIRPEDGLEVFGPYPLIPDLLPKKLPSRFVCVQHLFFLPRGGRLQPLQ